MEGEVRNSYEYKALPGDDKIRILELYSGLNQHPLRGRLHVESINHLPNYEAISYVWGDSSCVAAISCDDRDVGITLNLTNVLRRARLEDKSRFLWADAICINQGSAEERSQQVQLMGKIYRKARRVLVWLGNRTDDDGDNAFSIEMFLRELWTQIPKYIPNRRQVATEGYWGTRPDDIDNPEGWHALARLTRQDYFRRVWIQQEIGLASEALVIYGTESFPWTVLVRIFTFLQMLSTAEFIDKYKIVASNLVSLDHEFKRPATNNFLEVCEATRWCRCSDPRDRIFAMLEHPTARSAGGTKTIIVPDYSKSKFVVYRELAIQILLESKSLLLLASVHHGEEMHPVEATQLPSWAPQWDDPYFNSFFAFNHFRYRAAGGSQPQFELAAAAGLLTVRGMRVDAIARCSRAFRLEFNFRYRDARVYRGHPNPLREIWDNLALKEGTNYVAGGSALEAYRLTLVSSHYAGDDMSRMEANFAAYCRALDQQAMIANAGREEGDKKGMTFDLGEGRYDEGSAATFLREVNRCCAYKKLFGTSNGYIGSGPQALEDDDVVCVFFGFSLPVVLRSISNRWKIVGPCYVHGLMKGEAIEMVRRGELVEDQFILC